jgi:hypothetical protein
MKPTFLTSSLLLFISSALALPDPSLQKRTISQDLFDAFVRVAKFSHGAYQNSCPSPVGTTRLYTIRNILYDTDGYISRDDVRKEIIVPSPSPGRGSPDKS